MLEDIPGPFATDKAMNEWPRCLIGRSLDEIERAAVLGTLGSLNWDKRAAASQLGISLKTLYNKLHKWGLM